MYLKVRLKCNVSKVGEREWMQNVHDFKFSIWFWLVIFFPFFVHFKFISFVIVFVDVYVIVVVLEMWLYSSLPYSLCTLANGMATIKYTHIILKLTSIWLDKICFCSTLFLLDGCIYVIYICSIPLSTISILFHSLFCSSSI